MNDMFSLSDKTILITGASSGIGRECSIFASKLGANLVLIGRNEERLKNTLDSLEEGKHIYFSCDVTDYESLEGTIKQAVKEVGKICGFVHSAGIELTLPLRNMNHKKYEKLFAVNVISAFEIARLISKKKYLSPQGASFIFISSIKGLVGEIGNIGYCSSKSALLAGCKAMALELASKKIRVNSILPGVVETEMVKNLFDNISEEEQKVIIAKHPLGLGEPRDVANACAFLLSDASRWITGTNFVIDGGYSAQ